MPTTKLVFHQANNGPENGGKSNSEVQFENCTFSGKWVLQWTMPKIKNINGVNDAPFFFF